MTCMFGSCPNKYVQFCITSLSTGDVVPNGHESHWFWLVTENLSVVHMRHTLEEVLPVPHISPPDSPSTPIH